MIHPVSVHDGRGHTQGNRQQQDDDEGGCSQLGGGGHPLADLVGYRGLPDERLPEVAVQRPLQPVAVLDEKRAIETDLVAHPFNRGRADLVAEVAAAGQLLGRVAGGVGHQGEDQERQRQQRRHRDHQPADDVPPHPRSTSSS